jgi:hypothetical protein
MIKRLDVMSVTSNPIRVLLVPAGERPPNHPGANPNKADTVEFYALNHMHTPDGQFISEYYTATLLESSHDTGLDMYTSEPNWKISARTKGMVLDWINYHNYFKE